jgi:hypothetical protein
MRDAREADERVAWREARIVELEEELRALGGRRQQQQQRERGRRRRH